MGNGWSWLQYTYGFIIMYGIITRIFYPKRKVYFYPIPDTVLFVNALSEVSYGHGYSNNVSNRVTFSAISIEIGGKNKVFAELTILLFFDSVDGKF